MTCWRTIRRASCSFSAPRLDTVTEAGWFAGRLEESGLAVDALVVNRVRPVFWKKVDELPDVEPGSDFANLVENLRSICEINGRERATIAELVEQVAPAPVVRVPLLDADVHDLAGLSSVADALFGRHSEHTGAHHDPEESPL